MTLKRAGRGHDPEGVGNTPPGSLTVECPACPHPGRNLPENWREAGPLMYATQPPFGVRKFLRFAFRFLYILYISVDANFKLKGRNRRLEDIELTPGWGPFVEESEYRNFVSNYVDQPEVSTLSVLNRKL